MTEERDYLTFRDEIIFAIADEQEPPGLAEIDLFSLVQRRKIHHMETWVHLVGKDLERLGYGSDRSTMKNRRFLINGAGLEAATLLRRSKRPQSLGARAADLNWSMWSVVVAALALLAYIAVEAMR